MAAGKKGPKKHASKASSKQTAKFKATGGLKQKIQQRKRSQDLKKKIDTRKMLKGSKGKKSNEDAESDEAEESDAEMQEPAANEMDQLLQGQAQDDKESAEDSGSELEDDDLESLDEFADEAVSHKMDLQSLKEKDPEFYKYLQENDKDLLAFDGDDASSSGSAEEDDEEGQVELTKDMLKSLSKSIVQQNSLKALRTLLLAFRSATIGDTLKPGQEIPPFVIHSPSVFNKLVVSTLRYTPIVFKSHVPVKELPSGKFKLQTQNKKYAAIQRCVKSYFNSLTNLLNTLPNPSPQDNAENEDEVENDKNNMLLLAINESAKLIPFIMGNRQVAKHYLKTLLGYWSSTGKDSVRIAAFLAIRKMALAADDGIFELILKNTYQTFVATTKKTNVYTLPSINLMKNSASELFLLRSKTSYQLAFNYIRQLAILLRTSSKSTTKEAYQSVYNWQVVHSVDFWSQVLSTACAQEKLLTQDESPLQPLIYPLVQTSLGMLRLLPTSRFYPLHFHLIRSLLRIIQRTGIFIPLAPHLLSILDSAELKRKPKPSTQLKPLDFNYYIRAPSAYLRTRTYADGLCDELCYLLLEYFASMSLNIAFPELAIPPMVSIKKHLKKAGSNGKLVAGLKQILEKIDANKVWIEEKRSKVDFAPNNRQQLASFLSDEDIGKTPLGAQLRRERKIRDQKRDLLEKSAREEIRD